MRWASMPDILLIRLRIWSRCQPRSSAPNACNSSAITKPIREKRASFVDAGGDEHRLQALGGGQQDVGWISEYGGFVGLADIAVPEGAGTADQGCVPAEPYLDIVQQGADGADVEDAGGREIAPEDLGKDGEDGGLGLAAGSGGDEEDVGAVEDRPDGRFLQRAERAPFERVEDVVLERGVEAREAHWGSSISSTDTARSASVISALESVSS